MVECLDEKQHAAMNTNAGQKVGSFVGTHGKQNCLVICRIFGLTMCEWNRITGECFAYMKKFSIGIHYKTSYCYKFGNNRAVGNVVKVIAQLTIKNFVRLCQEQIWIHY